jgi:hypothetical protein
MLIMAYSGKFLKWIGRWAGAPAIMALSLLAATTEALPRSTFLVECPNKAALYRKVGAATVLIFVRENNLGGAGVFISPSIIATAKHIFGSVQNPTLDIFHAREIQPGRFDRGRHVQNISHRLYIDDRLDLALVQVDIASLNFLEIAGTLPAKNAPIIIVGHPDGVAWDFHDGRVTGFELSRNVFLFADPRLYFGNSGGPVCDCAGRVIGVVNSMNLTKDRNEAVAASEIKRALARFKPEVNYRVLPNYPNPRPVIINKREGNDLVVTLQNVAMHATLRYHLLHFVKANGRFKIFEQGGKRFFPAGKAEKQVFANFFLPSQNMETSTLLIPAIYLAEVDKTLAGAGPADDWPELLARQGLIHCLDKTQ